MVAVASPAVLARVGAGASADAYSLRARLDAAGCPASVRARVAAMATAATCCMLARVAADSYSVPARMATAATYCMLVAAGSYSVPARDHARSLAGDAASYL